MCGRFYVDKELYQEVESCLRGLPGTVAEGGTDPMFSQSIGRAGFDPASSRSIGRAERDPVLSWGVGRGGSGQALSQDVEGKRDIRPSDCSLVLRVGAGGISAQSMKWGFPGYQGGRLLINARSETALERRTFREDVLHRRCVIPARGFYEWDREKKMVTFYGGILFLAGCYHCFGEQDQFVILTTQANESVAPVHERMPLILETEEVGPWLIDGGAAQGLLHKKPRLLERSGRYEQMSLFT